MHDDFFLLQKLKIPLLKHCRGCHKSPIPRKSELPGKSAIICRRQLTTDFRSPEIPYLVSLWHVYDNKSFICISIVDIIDNLYAGKMMMRQLSLLFIIQCTCIYTIIARGTIATCYLQGIFLIEEPVPNFCGLASFAMA